MQSSWQDEGTIKLSVVGGRENGFRTYSVRENLKTGKWRVNIETLGGQVIGRVQFIIIQDTNLPMQYVKIVE